MKKFLFTSAIAASLLLVGCGEEAADPNDREVTSGGETEEAESAEDTTATETEAEPEEEEEPSVGVRSNPLPKGDTITETVVIHDNDFNGYEALLDLTVTEVIRGQEAWDIIVAENQFNEPAPEGYEYIMVKVKGELTDSTTDDYSYWFSTMYFNFVDEQGGTYETVSTVTPNELSSEMYNGGSHEGYIANQVKTGEKVYLTFDSQNGAPIFFALE